MMEATVVVFELRSHSRSRSTQMLCQVFKSKALTSQSEEPDPVAARLHRHLRCPAHLDQALARGGLC